MDYIENLVKRYPALDVCEESIRRAADIIINTYEKGGKLIAAGNGGSAADSDHICGELLKSFVKRRRVSADLIQAVRDADPASADTLAKSLQGSLPAVSLPAYSAALTACLNDVSGSTVFAQELNGLGAAGDTFLGISTSGNSENVVLALALARAKGLSTVLLTGRDGGKCAKLAECSIIVPERETYKIQELHLPVYHALCLTVEERFFPE